MTDKNVPQLIEALEAFEDGIYIITKKFKIIYMNKALKQAFGNGVGRTCYEFISNEKTVCPWCHHGKIFDEGKIITKKFLFRVLTNHFILLKCL